MKAIVHSLFYYSCGAPVLLVLVVVLNEFNFFFFAVLKILPVVSVALILKLKYYKSAFSAHINEVLEKQIQLWFKATRGTLFIILFLFFFPAYC